MNGPKLACPNLFRDVTKLKSFALDYGFDGIEWTLSPEDLPRNLLDEKRFVNSMSRLAPLEIRYHLFFPGHELGHIDVERARSAKHLFYNALALISKVPGRYATVHVGLGRDSMEGISWELTIAGLRDVAAKARQSGIWVCLENIVRGWTGRPNLYEKLIRETGCWGTLDTGHAQVCASVTNQACDVKDFALPHPERILSAHIYHEETMAGHIAPARSSDLEDRLLLLQRLPLCDWWVLELREEPALLQTLYCVREFLQECLVRSCKRERYRIHA
jgi:Xylose isomerase-like TIM barrel